MNTSSHRSALLVIDMINTWEMKDGTRLSHAARRIGATIARLAERARAHGSPVVYANDNFGIWQGGIDAVLNAARAVGNSNAVLVEQIAPQPQDYTILKPAHSAFFQSSLERLLETLNVSELCLTGVSGDQCVLATASDALLRNFRVVIPHDTLACPTPARTRAVLRHFDVAMDIPTPPAARVRFAAR